jgi:hypothetical protein
VLPVIDYLGSLVVIALGIIALIIVVCIVFIIGFTLWQITKRICEGIKQGMDERERHDR